jgi:hypothetical protein
MRERDDADLELRLRQMLADRLGSMPLELTAYDLVARRLSRERERRRRRGLLVLGLAAAVLLPAGWLAAGAPLPKPNDATAVMIDPSPTPAPSSDADAPGQPLPTSTQAPDVSGSGPARDLLVVTRGRLRGAPCENLDRYGTQTGEHRQLARCADRIAISDDGTKAALGSDRGIEIIDVRDGSRIDSIDVGEPAYPIAWSPSGRWLHWAACGSDADIKDPCRISITEPATDSSVRLPGGEGGGYSGVYWPPDESGIVTPDGATEDATDYLIGRSDGSGLEPLPGDSALAMFAGTGYGGDWPAAISPDGRSTIRVHTPWVDGRYDPDELRLASVDGGTARTLLTVEPGSQLLGVAWSPDSRSIAVLKRLPGDSGANQLWLIDLAGSTRQLALPDDLRSRFIGRPTPMEWSPDGSRLAVLDTVVPVDGSDPLVLPEATRRRWSRDWSSMAFVASAGAPIEVANADGSNRHLVADPGDNDFWVTWATP